MQINQQLSGENPEQLVYDIGLLILTVLGGVKLEGLDRMRVTLKLELTDSPPLPQASSLVVLMQGLQQGRINVSTKYESESLLKRGFFLKWIWSANSTLASVECC